MTTPAASPPCPHFGTCGGCSLQDRSDSAVAALKRDAVIRALRGAGIQTDVAETLTVPAQDRRRVKLAYTRTKKTAILGFNAAASHRVVPVPDCKIALPQIVAAMPVLAELLRPGAPRKRTLAVTVTASEAGLDVSVADGKDLDLALRENLGRSAEAAGLARLVWNGDPIVQSRPPFHRFGAARVVPPPGAFLQASAAGEAFLLDVVLEATRGARRIADLFSGCGAFALPLAATAEVTAVEGDAGMTAALDAGCRSAEGLHGVTATTRDLFRRPLLAEELDRFDAVVFDPPRVGAKAQAEEIARSRVPVVIGVSCMPGSFARDAAILRSGGYRLERVVPVDQFRWSTHVELAGVFSRE